MNDKIRDFKERLRAQSKELFAVAKLSSSQLIQHSEAVLPIKRVVYSGGGAKGAVYPGSYAAMVETGVCTGLEAVSGASAGAITGGLIACGMQPKEFREVFLKTNLKDLLGKRVTDFGKPGNLPFTRDGSDILKLLRDNINKSIATFFNDKPLEITEDNDSILEHLVTKINKDAPITFADLEALHNKWPEHFKLLTVIAVDQNKNGKPQIFDHKNTPNVEIALACRASASLPIVLEPVQIDFGGGVVRTFVDGGLYDNLPTDYFDTDDNGNYVPNTMREQTLVYAFGEGFDDSKNQVFQAQFGDRMDEIITDEILDVIFDSIRQYIHVVTEDEPDSDPQETFKQAVSFATSLLIDSATKDNGTRSEGETRCYQKITQLIKEAVSESTNYPEHTSDILTQWQFIIKFLKEKITPILYKPNFIEKFKRETLLSYLGGMNTDYKNTAQKELGYQRLRSQYPFRTVELRVGNLQTTDFGEATKHARVMDTLGYLDSINHIINHELYDEKFKPDVFYKEVVDNFLSIHSAVLEGADISDPLVSELKPLLSKLNLLERELRELKSELEEIEKLNSNSEILDVKLKIIESKRGTIEGQYRTIFHHIKQHAERNYDSPAAFALTRAIEYRSENIDANQLFKDVYEESFRRSSVFSQSKITGETIYTSASLRKALDKQNMFFLFEKQGRADDTSTRTGKIAHSLENIRSFKEKLDAIKLVEEIDPQQHNVVAPRAQ